MNTANKSTSPCSKYSRPTPPLILKVEVISCDRSSILLKSCQILIFLAARFFSSFLEIWYK